MTKQPDWNKKRRTAVEDIVRQLRPEESTNGLMTMIQAMMIMMFHIAYMPYVNFLWNEESHNILTDHILKISIPKPLSTPHYTIEHVNISVSDMEFKPSICVLLLVCVRGREREREKETKFQPHTNQQVKLRICVF